MVSADFSESFNAQSRIVFPGGIARTPGRSTGGGWIRESEITVKAHRGKVMRKMNADSLADLVTMAAALGVGRHDVPER
jgi:hypothetical protein